MQVTRCGVYVTDLIPGGIRYSTSKSDSSGNLVLGAISGGISCVVTVSRSGEAFTYRLFILEVDGAEAKMIEVGSHQQSSYEPTSLGIGRVRDSVLLLVGTSDGSLDVLSAHASSGLIWHGRESLRSHGLSEGPGAVDSLAVTTKSESSHHKTSTIFCVLRGGGLLVLNFHLSIHPHTARSISECLLQSIFRCS